ncbi:fumarylacetoacetate hydrolase family protein [Maritalea myrionectae]|uniref:fumarylacetoacetate hydrolase family protein n=1 Tax=Maritalea myrionectae TaxID=454601 RepID=UPI000410717B|nr:fumarylacetoacetate hydrolase family protein [Maritalea myrionectae]
MYKLDHEGIYLGRIWSAQDEGPCIVTIRDWHLFDITCAEAPTVRDILERPDAAQYVKSAPGKDLGPVEVFAAIGERAPNRLLAPCDLQAIKACGVTFASSMVERVIEEQAAGDAQRANAVRAKVGAAIGDSLKTIKAGSPEAEKVKKALQQEGLWSQYLEVGIGPDAEVFSKAQTLSSVGAGADVGIHPMSSWNNPEPEIVLAVASDGRIQGATLGNDVNLRDVEGRSALLLSKAKDNNASCAIGPFIRLFDDTFSLDDVRNAEVDLLVEGEDDFVLRGHSSMKEISRDPEELVSQVISRHHQYPDGFMLFLGTLFAPTEDRDEPGQGFTHKIGDKVTISTEKLGALTNIVRLSTECPEWTFGISHLMRNLSARNLI